MNKFLFAFRFFSYIYKDIKMHENRSNVSRFNEKSFNEKRMQKERERERKRERERERERSSRYTIFRVILEVQEEKTAQ